MKLQKSTTNSKHIHKLNKSGLNIWFVIPAVIIMGIIIAYPVFSSIVGSFYRNIMGTDTFVGVHNYQVVFTDELFYTSLFNNLKLFLCVPIETIFSLLIAVILFNKIRGWRFYRTIIFLPYVLAITVVGVIFAYIFQLNGVLNTMLRGLGLDSVALDWLGKPDNAIWSVAFVIVWKQFGFGVVLFLARLMSINPSLLEAADIDGANWFQKFRKILIPQTMPVIEFFLIITLIDMLSWVFAYVFSMTGGGPAQSTSVLEFLIYKKSFYTQNAGYGLAVSVVVLAIASTFIVIQKFLSRKGDYDNE